VTTADAITSVDVWPVDVPLTDPFVISRGRTAVAKCAFVRVGLAGGAVGYGEIAPFEALTGETRDAAVDTARRLSGAMLGRRAREWDAMARALAVAAPDAPASRAGLECAAADAHARTLGKPLYEMWGGGAGGRTSRPPTTDITLPILAEARIDELGGHWYALGFRVFKLKVGEDAVAERARVERIARRYADVSFILDANQGFDRATARAFLRAVEPWRERIAMLEQPLARSDIAGLAALRAEAVLPIAADESVFTLADARRVVDARAADVINLKVMKSGLAETIAIARTAREAGVRLMIGGMLETRLGMAVSLSLVLGLGGIEFLDLDTPLLMARDPWRGGYAYDGPRLVPWTEPGLGMEPA
jgi:o-succinylbenzoate synthase